MLQEKDQQLPPTSRNARSSQTLHWASLLGDHVISCFFRHVLCSFPISALVGLQKREACYGPIKAAETQLGYETYTNHYRCASTSASALQSTPCQVTAANWLRKYLIHGLAVGIESTKDRSWWWTQGHTLFSFCSLANGLRPHARSITCVHSSAVSDPAGREPKKLRRAIQKLWSL